MLYHAPLTSLVERAHRALLESGNDDITADGASASFAHMVAPSLRYNRALGNIYSGSLYASIAGLIDDPTTDLGQNTRIGCFSYGSGACAELFDLTPAPTARATVGELGIDRHLAERRPISLEEYERQVRALDRALTLADFVPDMADPDGLYETHYAGRRRLVLDRVENHHRRYRWT
jgi:3-hydroxy-3-methylglutaryl CoA synthase